MALREALRADVAFPFYMSALPQYDGGTNRAVRPPRTLSALPADRANAPSEATNTQLHSF
jgi:hypothetical protein